MKKLPKQVLVVRKDLNMRKGKIASQASHASLGGILNYGTTYENLYIVDRNDNCTYKKCIVIPLEDETLDEWLSNLFTKVCVSVDSEQELIDIYNKAVENGLNTKLITDVGLTEFNNVPTLTCLSIGPADPDVLDPITGHLKLL